MQFNDAVNGFVAGYFSTCNRSVKTQTAYKIDLAQLTGHVGAATQVEAIESECLEGWATALRLTGYASGSIRRKFATAKVFFAYWVRKGALEKSPLWKIRLDLGRERVLPRNLSPEDTTRLIEEAWHRLPAVSQPNLNPADPYFLRLRNVAALEILFATGIRVGELVSLTMRDWREEDKALTVKGKGARQRLAFLPDTRSLKTMQLYLARRRAMSLDHDSLLLNASGNAISTQGVARIVTLTAKDAGVAVRVTPHMIRHTVATLLLRYGADIRIVQEVLGNASIVTTQRYTHVSKEHMIAALNARHPNHHLKIRWDGGPEPRIEQIST
jgi:site-specific recombinase XerD